MKRFTVLLSAALLSLSFAACNNKTEAERVYDETSRNRNQGNGGSQEDPDNPDANGNNAAANTGTPHTAQAPANPNSTAAPGQPEPTTAAGGNAQGAAIYKQYCATCHQANGQGLANIYPPLAKSDWLNADPQRAVAAVANGLSGEIMVNGKKYNSMMPAAPYDDQQIADVMTYVFSSWGNNGTAVSAADVKKVRKK